MLLLLFAESIEEEGLQHQQLLDHLQQRQQVWFVAQMVPCHLQEERLTNPVESLARTSERVVSVMIEGLRGMGQHHHYHPYYHFSPIPQHHQRPPYPRQSASDASMSFPEDLQNFWLVFGLHLAL